MSKDYTNIMRGIAILMIMVAHCGSILHTRLLTPLGGGGNNIPDFKRIWRKQVLLSERTWLLLDKEDRKDMYTLAFGMDYFALCKFLL